MKLPDIHTVHTKRNHLNLRRILAVLIITIVLVSLLSTSLPFGIDTKTASAADTIFYDFIAQAPYASWGSGAGSLPFPGSDSDSRGFACYRDNAQLEDNSTRTRVLETHPQWTSNGWIMGRYPQLTIPAGAQLRVAVGFLKGATGTDGATFKVQFEEGQNRQTILSYRATYDGKLDSITKSLRPLAGRTGHFILHVNAGQSSGQDWAAWAEARIEIAAPPAPPALPDLIVDRIECGPGNKLSVTIKNVGSGALPGGWTAVAEAYFDGAKRGVFDLKHPTSTVGGGIDKPGGSSTYLVAWDIAGPVIVRVLVDPTNNITESNEQNNIREQQVEPCEIALPDLVVVDIRQEGNSIRYKIENAGEASVVNPAGGTTPFCNALFIDGGLVATDCVNIHEMLPGQWIDNPFDYYWEMTPPQHIIKVCADWDQNVNEKNEGNNCLEQTWYMEEKLPDLIIEVIKCDQENSQIGYVVKNIGEKQAKAGHATTLYVDGEEVSHDLVTVDLKSGASYESWFKEYEWPECKTIKVKICADNYNQVTEGDEQNNCQEKTCECIVDITQPRIISGPTVSQVTETSAVICWGTDEASDSRTGYDYRSGEYGRVLEDSNLVKEHCLSLTKLEPATTYHFIIESADSSGNKVMSRDLSFETLSLPDVERPSLSLLIPDTLSGTVPISADAEDNIGVDRVVFFLDGEQIYTDYTYPFEWECDTRILGEGPHDFRTQSFDGAGNMAAATRVGDIQNQFPEGISPVRVQIITPEAEAEVYGEVPIGVKVTHDLGSKICYMRVELDEEIIWDKDYVEEFGYCVGVPGVPLFETCFWDFSGLRPGSTHYIVVGVEDEHENWGHAAIRVRISEPEIRVSRPEPTRHGNYFEVTLVIENNGDVDISDITIADANLGFQAINYARTSIVAEGPFSPPQPCNVVDTREGRSSQLQYQHAATLGAGSVLRLRYYVVPILFGPEESISYMIGHRLLISYRAGDESCSQEIDHLRYASSRKVDDAFRSADYLILTNPSQLFDRNDDAAVNDLLSTMAELAKEKQGVLGYVPHEAYDPVPIKHNLRYWGSNLSPGWQSDGYLLLVGETEIIPSFDLPSSHGAARGGDIDCSDYLYADIHGDIKPELRVGRIVGDDAETLVKPIRASINIHKHVHGHDFDRSHALLCSGNEGSWEQFVDTTNQIGAILSSYGTTPDYMHWEYYITEVGLLREALLILGKQWECLEDDPKPFPHELDHLSDLTCIYTCTDDPAATPGRHETGERDEDGNKIYCPKTHPPHNLYGDDGLYELISMDDAILVEEVRRHGDPCEIYDYHFPRADGTTTHEFGIDQMIAKMPGKDIFYWTGHGGRGSWRQFDRGTFGGSHPMVFSNSCWTGAYEDRYGAPESSFKAGAAIFIGATEPGLCGHGFEFARKFFAEEWLPGTSCGDALTELKVWMMTVKAGDSGWRFTAYEYNLYGDPKFGE